MEPAFERSTIIRLLKGGLVKPNPANPEVPMWTLEDFDQLSPGVAEQIATANNHPTSFPNGYIGVQFKNLAREHLPVGEAVEIIDPKDLAT